MIQNNTYQPELSRTSRNIAGRPYQNQFYQGQSYQNQPSYCNQSQTPRAYYMNNPQINHSVHVIAFAELPAELGGETLENRSQFSGVPNW